MPKEITPTRARGGVFTGRVFLVLVTSLLLAVIAGVVLYTLFYPFE